MPEEIFKGIDCRKTYGPPFRKIRIRPRRARIQPGHLVTLHAHHAPYDCDPGCYRWVLAAGGGQMSPETGKSTNYRAPQITINKDCQYTAFIALFVGAQLLDTAIFTMVTFDDGRIAYERLSLDREIEHLPPHYAWPVPGLPAPPAGALSNHARMYTWAYRYTCNDELIDKASWVTRDFFWTWKGPEIGWRLIHTVTAKTFMGYPHAITYYNNLEAKRDGELIDRRSDRIKAMGCCPLRLIVEQFEEALPDPELPYL